MPLVDLPAPTNCEPYHQDRFVAALVASPTFQAMVGTTDPAVAAGYVFGKRVTHSRNGRVWTREELAELRHLAMVQSEAYGKRLSPFGSYRPFGVTALWLQRLLPAESLYDNGDGPNPTDVQEREWQNISGKICDEIIAHFDGEGPTNIVDQFDMVVDGSTSVASGASQGVWQERSYQFTWSEK